MHENKEKPRTFATFKSDKKLWILLLLIQDKILRKEKANLKFANDTQLSSWSKKIFISRTNHHKNLI